MPCVSGAGFRLEGGVIFLVIWILGFKHEECRLSSSALLPHHADWGKHHILHPDHLPHARHQKETRGGPSPSWGPLVESKPCWPGEHHELSVNIGIQLLKL